MGMSRYVTAALECLVCHNWNILYLFPRPEVALWAWGGQGAHELHASFSKWPKDMVILGKRNWEAVWMTQFWFDDVTITAARQSTSTLTYGAHRHHQCNNRTPKSKHVVLCR